MTTDTTDTEYLTRQLSLPLIGPVSVTIGFINAEDSTLVGNYDLGLEAVPQPAVTAGVVELGFIESGCVDSDLGETTEAKYSSRGNPATSSMDQVRKELHKYSNVVEEALTGYLLSGDDVHLKSIRLAKPTGTAFQRAVWSYLCRIENGTTKTYGEASCAVSSGPNAARAVGSAAGKNPLPVFIPCHRLVATQGLGGFAGGLQIKTKLLQIERAFSAAQSASQNTSQMV